MVFEGGIFTPEVLNDARTTKVLLDAADSAAVVHPSDILRAVINSGDPKVLAVLSTGLPEGAQANHLREIIDVYRPRASSLDFDGTRERFSTSALAALDEFGAAFRADQVRLRPVCLELL